MELVYIHLLLLLNEGFEYDHDQPNRGPLFLKEPSTYMDGPSEDYVDPLKRVTLRNLCRRDCAEEIVPKSIALLSMEVLSTRR